MGKTFARVVLKGLQKIAERVYPESQCGFRAKRSTIDMVFSVRQLQEKYREQGKPLYMAFIDLTKAFDLVSRKGLFKILEKIGCPPTLLSITRSFHEDMKGTIVYEGSNSEEFNIRSGVKQGCVLAPTFFGIFFSVLLKHAFRSSSKGIYLRTRSDGKLFNLARLKAKTKVRDILIRELLFADDAAVTAHTLEDLQHLIYCFAEACTLFGLTISLKKTQVMGQGVEEPPSIHIQDYELETVHEFMYLGSTVTDNLTLDSELNKCIGKAATTLSRLSKRVWCNNKLTKDTKVEVYKACILSTLLYGSETWTLYSNQERRLNAFHMRRLRRILDIPWKDKVPNTKVLERAGITSLYTILKQRHLRWLDHVSHMEDGCIPKDLLYGELSLGNRPAGRPKLRYKDVCKSDLKDLGIEVNTWESVASDRCAWRLQVKDGLSRFEESQQQKTEEKRLRRKARARSPEPSSSSTFMCNHCGRVCYSRIGLYSHSRRCSST